MFNTDQKIQAPTTNSNPYGLMATPAVDLTPTGHLPYLVAQADTAPIRAEAEQILTQCCQRRPDRDPATGDLLSGVEDTDETSRDRLVCVERHSHDGDHRDAMHRTWPRTVQDAEQIERLIAALPDAVHESMRKTLPGKFTPELADAIATCMIAELRQPSTPTACPDGVAWCDGDPHNHTDTDVHRHEGPEYGLSGSYVQGAWFESIVGFQLAQWDDGEPRLVFQADGSWPDLGLPQVDQLIGDAVPWLVQLIAARRRLAIEVSPNRSTVPFAESEDKQMASAGFDLATAAMDIALAKSEDRAGTLRALRNFLDLAEAEQA